MEKAVKGGCSPFSRLPDDIVIQIYNKIMDLKTLCYCQLISKHLGLIVFQVDNVLFNVPLRIALENENRPEDIKILFESYRLPIVDIASAVSPDYDPPPLLGLDSIPSAIRFIKRFRKLKSICIQFPSYVQIKVAVSFLYMRMEMTGIRGDWCGKEARKSEDLLEEEELELELEEEEEEEGVEEEEEEGSDDEDTDEYEMENEKHSVIKAIWRHSSYYSCLKYVLDRFKKVFACTVEFPLLEKVFIMDSSESGIATLSGGEIDKMRNLLH
uniref:uncharacterized protein LOC122585525 n=1 Tax=Erigeron canadensis TaxID=72917 RepID=UPI001CB9A0C9|nr:uncharacterized protein LOC122585525 [Erigeron canadensis]